MKDPLIVKKMEELGKYSELQTSAVLKVNILIMFFHFLKIQRVLDCRSWCQMFWFHLGEVMLTCLFIACVWIVRVHHARCSKGKLYVETDGIIRYHYRIAWNCGIKQVENILRFSLMVILTWSFYWWREHKFETQWKKKKKINLLFYFSFLWRKSWKHQKIVFMIGCVQENL